MVNQRDIEILAQHVIAPQSIIQSMIALMGDDPSRPGLEDTPARVLRSWRDLFDGYRTDVARLFTTFDDHEKYTGIVLCKQIEFVSFCEHHLLPFVGVAHVAYIPDGKVIGLSKLARVLDAYAKRLQMQERIGQQVVAALDTYLNPNGAACIIEAKHMCMSCRGVSKQHSSMVTSSLSGAFLNEPSARAELLTLIRL